jgi:hypothetical protein
MTTRRGPLAPYPLVSDGAGGAPRAALAPAPEDLYLAGYAGAVPERGSS